MFFVIALSSFVLVSSHFKSNSISISPSNHPPLPPSPPNWVVANSLTKDFTDLFKNEVKNATTENKKRNLEENIVVKTSLTHPAAISSTTSTTYQTNEEPHLETLSKKVLSLLANGDNDDSLQSKIPNKLEAKLEKEQEKLIKNQQSELDQIEREITSKEKKLTHLRSTVSKLSNLEQDALRFKTNLLRKQNLKLKSNSQLNVAKIGGNVEFEDIGVDRLGRCRVCIYVMERIKEGYMFDLSSICNEIVMKKRKDIASLVYQHALGKDFAACQQVIASFKQWGPSVKQWLQQGCFKLGESETNSSLPQASLVKPCPSHTICSAVSYIEEEHVFCDIGDNSEDPKDSYNSLRRDGPTSKRSRDGLREEGNFGVPGQDSMNKVPKTLG
eukprot:g6544.t1